MTIHKHIVVANEVNKAIIEVGDMERKLGGKNSYSKIVNYLVTLGIDKYNKLLKTNIKSPKFDFDKYYRKI